MTNVLPSRRLVLPALALALLAGCHRDRSRVLARVGTTQRVTETELGETVSDMAPSAETAKAFLSDPAQAAQREAIVRQLAFQKALLQYGRQKGMDKDPKVQRDLARAEAQAYFEALLKARLPEPTEAQLKTFYDEQVAQRKAEGQDKGLPTFEEVKSRLPQIWRKQKEAEAAAALKQEIEAKVPVRMADGAAK